MVEERHNVFVHPQDIRDLLGVGIIVLIIGGLVTLNLVNIQYHASLQESFKNKFNCNMREGFPYHSPTFRIFSPLTRVKLTRAGLWVIRYGTFFYLLNFFFFKVEIVLLVYFCNLLFNINFHMEEY